MKNKSFIYCLAAAAVMGLASCGTVNRVPESSDSSNPSTPSSAPSISSEDSDVTGGTFIDKSGSFKGALAKDYSNMTVASTQVYDEDSEYDIEYYVDGYIVVYSEAGAQMGSPYVYYHDYGDSNYMYFSPDYLGTDSSGKAIYGPEAWLDAGYKDAPLSIWNTYFHMPTLLKNIHEDDVVYASGVYMVKSQDLIDSLSETAFQYAWFNNPTYIGFIVDSETGCFKKIMGIDDPEDDDSPYFSLEISAVGSTVYTGTLPTEPDETNVIPYWQYKGWDGPWEDKYPTAVNIAVSGEKASGDFDSVLEIEDWDPVTYSILPDDYNTWADIEWYTSDENVASVGYPWKDMNTKSVIANGEGECEIWASVVGANKQRIESNHLKIKVNPLKSQDRTGTLYDLTFEELDTATHELTVNNACNNNLPVSATAIRSSVQSGGYSGIWADYDNVLMLNCGVAANSDDYMVEPTVSFDFGDQQVSTMSFYYGFYYSADRYNLNFLTKAVIETSNDGENWESIDVLDEIKENVSGDNVKLCEKSFAPASKVRLVLASNFVGKAIRLSLTGAIFNANEECHSHE